MKRTLILSVALLLMVGCDSMTSSDHATDDVAETAVQLSESFRPHVNESSLFAATKSLILGEPFRLQIGETGLFHEDGSTVRFDSVSTDSRCPVGVDCVRAGKAVVHFTLQEEGVAAMPFRLEIEGMLIKVQDIEHYQFQIAGRYAVALLLLQPYPGLVAEADMPLTATLEMRYITR